MEGAPKRPPPPHSAGGRGPPDMEECVEMPSLGRSFNLGALYDCRTDCLIPGLSLWTQDHLKEFVTIPQSWSDGSIISSDDLDSKASALKVNAQVKLSFLSGMVDVSGSGEYLKNTANSLRTSRLVLSYQCTSRVECLTAQHLNQLDYKEEIFTKSEPTHVVTGILFGANAFVVFDHYSKSDDEKKHIAGQLSVVAKKSITIEGKGAVDMTEEEKGMTKNLTCRFHGDFRPRTNPTTYEDALHLYRDLPEFLTSDDKHVPIKVWLYPISKLYSSATKLFLSISLDLIDQVSDRMETLGKVFMSINDLLLSETIQSFVRLEEKVRQFRELLIGFKLLIQQRLQQILPSIKSGKSKEQELFDLLAEWDNSPFQRCRIDGWIMDYKALDLMLSKYIDSFTRVDNIHRALAFGSVEAAMLDTNYEFVAVFYFHLNAKDYHLKAMSACVSSRTLGQTDVILDDGELPLCERASDSMLKAAKSFLNFAECNKETKMTKFIFAEYAVETNEVSGEISVFRDGELVAENFLPPSAPGTPMVTRTEGNTVALRWDAPEYGEDVVTFYRVLLNPASPRLDSKESSNPDVGSGETRDVNGTETVLYGLKPCQVYRVKVEAWCKYGVGNATEEVLLCTNLSRPSKPTVTQISPHTCHVEWKSTDDDMNINDVKYEVEFEENGKCHTVITDKTAIDLSLKSGRYTFRVRTVFTNQKSEFSLKSDILVMAKKIIDPIELKERIRTSCKRVDYRSNLYELPMNKSPDDSELYFNNICVAPVRVIVFHQKPSDAMPILNLMINYILGVRPEDKFRFVLPHEIEQRNFMAVFPQDGFRVPCMLSFGFDEHADDDCVDLHVLRPLHAGVLSKPSNACYILSGDETKEEVTNEDDEAEIYHLDSSQEITEHNLAVLGRLFTKLMTETFKIQYEDKTDFERATEIQKNLFLVLNKIEQLFTERKFVENHSQEIDDNDPNNVEYTVEVLDFLAVTTPVETQHTDENEVILGVANRLVYYQTRLMDEQRDTDDLKRRFGTTSAVILENMTKKINELELEAALVAGEVVKVRPFPGVDYLSDLAKYLDSLVVIEKRDTRYGWETRVDILNEIKKQTQTKCKGVQDLIEITRNSLPQEKQ